MRPDDLGTAQALVSCKGQYGLPLSRSAWLDPQKKNTPRSGSPYGQRHEQAVSSATEHRCEGGMSSAGGIVSLTGGFGSFGCDVKCVVVRRGCGVGLQSPRRDSFPSIDPLVALKAIAHWLMESPWLRSCRSSVIRLAVQLVIMSCSK